LSFSTTPTGAAEAPEHPPASLKPLLREIVETVLLTVVIYAVVNFATGRFRVEGDKKVRFAKTTGEVING